MWQLCSPTSSTGTGFMMHRFFHYSKVIQTWKLNRHYHHPPKAMAATPPPPRILRRPHTMLTSPGCPDSRTSPTTASAPQVRSPASSDFETPPPPPRSGRPASSGTSCVPETPESELRCTFAEVVRAPAAAALKAGAQPTRTRLKSAIAVPPRSNYIQQDRSLPRQGYRRTPTAAREPHRASAARASRPVRPRRGPAPSEPGWNEVKRRYWWRSARRIEARHQPGSPPRENSSRGSQQHSWPLRPRESPSPALRAFRSKTAGKCFICLAPDHRSASCRDPIRCFRCRRSGHRERTRRAAASTAGEIQSGRRVRACYVPKLPPPPPRTATSVMALLGDPATRPDEDECYIPSSYAINSSLREWEDTAAVT
ncbi:hypothetical protein BS78_05G025200 [Paspalum vaginatum]|nr:hypothetical protein BS78_05G025200 [Paspalum vaginatum]